MQETLHILLKENELGASPRVYFNNVCFKVGGISFHNKNSCPSYFSMHTCLNVNILRKLRGENVSNYRLSKIKRKLSIFRIYLNTNKENFQFDETTFPIKTVFK